jgi:(1->4)-alpha-D-glucan 1-alpha-D-glucosylmutase
MGTLAKPFLTQFMPFQKRIAELGMVNSLSQLTLKIASPGVPDFFQGSELWDLNLVDPDNRRPIDFENRRATLAGISKQLAESSPCCAKLTLAKQLLRDWHDGAVKLFVTAQGLGVRKRSPSLFLHGDYLPLQASGPAAANVVAFARRFEGEAVVAVAPRLITGITGFESGLPLGSEWGETELELGELAARPFHNIFTGEPLRVGADGRARMEELFAAFPVALLTDSGDV